jgi:hypothetical protein
VLRIAPRSAVAALVLATAVSSGCSPLGRRLESGFAWLRPSPHGTGHESRAAPANASGTDPAVPARNDAAARVQHPSALPPRRSVDGAAPHSAPRGAGSGSTRAAAVPFPGRSADDAVPLDEYIEHELRDASPEEREFYLKSLRDAPDDRVRLVLRARRSMQELNAATRPGPLRPRESQADRLAAGSSPQSPADEESPIRRTSHRQSAAPSYLLPPDDLVPGVRRAPAPTIDPRVDGVSADVASARRNAPPAADDETTPLARLIEAVQEEVAGLQPGPSPEDRRLYVERHVFLRLLYLMAGQEERTLAYIPGIDAAEQQFWQQMMFGIVTYLDPQPAAYPAQRTAQAIEAMEEGLQHLREAAPLELGAVSFCRKINSFGDYEKFPRDEFAPGETVLVYAEVRNFHSELTQDGHYRTLLRSTLEIRRANGDVVEQIPFNGIEDLCRSRRRDYFHSYTITIPKSAGPGPHRLSVVVEDQLRNKVATTHLNFVVR